MEKTEESVGERILLKEDFDEEKAFDEEIAPKAEELIGACRRHSIPAIVCFCYGGEIESDASAVAKIALSMYLADNRVPAEMMAAVVAIANRGEDAENAVSQTPTTNFIPKEEGQKA